MTDSKHGLFAAALNTRPVTMAHVEAAFAVELRALAQQLAQWHDRVERSTKACAPPFADDGEETGDVVWLRG